MKKLTFLIGVAFCAAFVFSSCKSSRESAYKKAYEKAKQQELAQPATTQSDEQQQQAPVADVPVVVKQNNSTSNENAREEHAIVQGNGVLKEYSVVCGSFLSKTNADALTQDMKSMGYAGALEAQNPDTKMYRVIISTFDDKGSAIQARDSFKAKYPDRKDFQGSWILRRIQ